MPPVKSSAQTDPHPTPSTPVTDSSHHTRKASSVQIHPCSGMGMSTSTCTWDTVRPYPGRLIVRVRICGRLLTVWGVSGVGCLGGVVPRASVSCSCVVGVCVVSVGGVVVGVDVVLCRVLWCVHRRLGGVRVMVEVSGVQAGRVAARTAQVVSAMRADADAAEARGDREGAAALRGLADSRERAGARVRVGARVGRA